MRSGADLHGSAGGAREVARDSEPRKASALIFGGFIYSDGYRYVFYPPDNGEVPPIAPLRLPERMR